MVTEEALVAIVFGLTWYMVSQWEGYFMAILHPLQRSKLTSFCLPEKSFTWERFSVWQKLTNFLVLTTLSENLSEKETNKNYLKRKEWTYR